jgi:hypothetical protein
MEILRTHFITHGVKPLLLILGTFFAPSTATVLAQETTSTCAPPVQGCASENPSAEDATVRTTKEPSQKSIRSAPPPVRSIVGNSSSR